MEIEWVEKSYGDDEYDTEHHAEWDVGCLHVCAFVYRESGLVSGWELEWREKGIGYDRSLLRRFGPKRKTLKGAKAAAIRGAQKAVAPYAQMMLDYAATVDPDDWPRELQRAAILLAHRAQDAEEEGEDDD